MVIKMEPSLDALKEQEEKAFRKRQAAKKSYNTANGHFRSIQNKLEFARLEYYSTRDRMNREFEALQEENKTYREVWGDYERIRDSNNSQIESLRSNVDYEYRMMKEAYFFADSVSRTANSKNTVATYLQEAAEHKANYKRAQSKIQTLMRENQKAKWRAQLFAPMLDGSDYREAKEAFKGAKKRFLDIQASYKQAKFDRDFFRKEFKIAKAEHERVKRALRELEKP